MTPGEFDFEIGTAGAATLVLQTVLPILATAEEASRIAVSGGTHVPRSPSYHFLVRNWSPIVDRLGLRARVALDSAGFLPRGEGRLSAEVSPWTRPTTLDLSERGALLAIRGVSAAARLKGDVAQRQAEAARALFWERKRLESEWDVADLPASSPGSFLPVEAVFENGRAAFGFLGERGVPAEILAERAGRRLLRFIEEETGCVDPWLADQLAVPLALARGGGRVTTPEVTSHLETVATVLRRFGVEAATWGRPGGPGGLEVPRW